MEVNVVESESRVEQYNLFFDSDDNDASSLLHNETREPAVGHIKHSKRANRNHTICNIIKSFVGAGILFLPRAFYNGGIILSLLTIIVLFVIEMYCMMLLIECCEESGAIEEATGAGNFVSTDSDVNFGDVGCKVFGQFGQIIINFSIVISQLGFCSVYGLFVAANLKDAILSFSGCEDSYNFNSLFFIVIQIICYVPLSWIRRIKYFISAIFLADLFILVGISITFYLIVCNILSNGIDPNIKPINYSQWPLMLGTMLFVWEGIALVLPVRAAMRQEIQNRYAQLLLTTLLCVLVVMIMFASIAYLAYGINTQSLILLNLNRSPAADLIQIMFVLVGMITYPLQMFPASKIIDEVFFGYNSTPDNFKQKWMKNLIRTVLVVVTLTISYMCMKQLDNVLALIGGVCCLPLAIIYPPLFHTILDYRKFKANFFNNNTFPNNLMEENSGLTINKIPNNNSNLNNVSYNLQQPLIDGSNYSTRNNSIDDHLSSIIAIYAISKWKNIFIDFLLILFGISISIFTLFRAVKLWQPHDMVTRCGIEAAKLTPGISPITNVNITAYKV